MYAYSKNGLWRGTITFLETRFPIMSCLHTMTPNTYRLKTMLPNLPPQGRQSHASPLRTGPRVSSTCIKHLRQVMQWCGCVYETNQETETWCIIVRHTTWPTPTYIHTLTTVHSEEVLSLGTFVRQTNPKLAK